MTSKERVKAAIHFNYPDKIPVHLPIPYESDIVWIFPKARVIKEWEENGNKYRISQWGSTWNYVSEENMGEVVEPAVKDWNNYISYKLPDANKIDNYSHVQATIDKNPDKYIMGVLSTTLFPHYWEIRGLVNFFTDIYDDIEHMEELLDRIVDLQLESVEIWSKFNIDGIVVGFDDWGLQNALMIDPKLWVKYFKPRYKKVWDKIHEYGFDVILHSCGNILSIMDDMIEIGLNVINMDQQENMGLEVISEKLKGKVCFWNPADIQTVLINGTPEEIDTYVKKMITALSDKSGGFIGKYYSQPNAAGHLPISSKASFDAFVKYGEIFN